MRRELGIRTVFNLLGPLTNPAGARRQVLGVYSESLVEPIAHVLAKLGTEHAMVVHGAGGLDELTPTGENLVSEVRDGEVRTYTLDPRPLSTGPGPGSPDDLRCGGDPAQNAAVILTVFDGEKGPRRDAVILNAAAALTVGGVVPEIERGIELAVDDHRLRRRAREAPRAGRLHPRAGAGGGMSGYLTQLSGDIRRAAPEPARGFAEALTAGPGHHGRGRDQAGVAVAGLDRARGRRRRDARAYAAGGAAAMSVLCAERDFGGSLDDLAAARRAADCRRSQRTSPCSRAGRRPAPGRRRRDPRHPGDGERRRGPAAAAGGRAAGDGRARRDALGGRGRAGDRLDARVSA